MTTDRQTGCEITVFQCASGHSYVYRHECCPACGERLHADRRPNEGRLIAHTTVRVNPSGVPFGLGIAMLEGGAKTLCVIEGDVPGECEEPVRLYLKGGLFHAKTAGNRPDADRGD